MLQKQVYILLIQCLIGTNSEFHEIVTKFGIIRGKLERSIIDGTEFYAYRGIPYAKRITEETKFQDSKPVEPWNGILDATKYGNSCITVDYKSAKMYTGEVDCLFLNVYVPKRVQRRYYTYQKPFSTMFTIPGGGFIIGNGNEAIYGAEYLMREGIILATINHRLGPIGFLNLGIASSPGNMGLKDQTIALRFYRDVIVEAVGGDPNSITLQGVSSGAASVSYHVLSPMSRGLFRGGIQESGSSMSVWVYDDNPELMIERAITIFNLTSRDPEGIAEELTKRSAREIVLSYIDWLTSLKHVLIGELAFIPSKEKQIEGVEQFLPGRPHDLMFSGSFNRVPILYGVNSDDAFLYAKKLKDVIGNDPRYLLTIFPFNLSYLFEDVNSAYSQIFPLYSGETIDFRNSNFLNDLLYYFDAWTTWSLYYKFGIPAYSYFFQYRSTNPRKLADGISENVCVHADEVFYIFYSHETKNNYSPGTTDFNITTLFTKTWANFVKTGNPTPRRSNFPHWKPYNRRRSVMTIDTNLVLSRVTNLEQGFNSKICFILSLMRKEIQDQFKPLWLC